MKAYVKVLFGVLQKEGGASHTSRSLDANHAVAPIDSVHQRATHGSIEVLH